MTIHLIRSSELEQHHFIAIYDLIRQYPGPVQYAIHEKPVEFTDDELIEEVWTRERRGRKNIEVFDSVHYSMCESPIISLPWNSIFDQCEGARKKHRIPESEPVVLLTENANEYNWFSAADPKGKLNLFVQTGMWDDFISEDFRYPVAYELASIPLQLKMFDSFRALVDYSHRDPRGCMNDLCIDKLQVRLKLRTGDICPDCRNLIQSRRVDPQLADQVFRIFEGIRTQMLFRSPVTGNARPSRLRILHDTRKILLTDLGNLEIPLNPMEKTVFHFFINHPEGLAFSTLPNHKDELCQLYRHYSDTASVATIIARMTDLAANKNDLLSQVISRIRRKFEAALPQEMAKQYVVGGVSGRKRRIVLDRELVTG